MQTRWPLYLGALFLTLVLVPAARATPYCDQISCHVPPTAYCSQECLDCERGAGTEYPGGFGGGGSCDNPTVITVADCGCPCLVGTLPDFLRDLKPGPPPSLPVPKGQPVPAKEEHSSKPNQESIQH
jgi:hypothetical protein